MNSNSAIIALYRSDFMSFLKFAFRELHPGKQLEGNWHVDVMADRLERLLRGDVKRLMINIPPRSLKSFCGSIALTAFALGRRPTKRILLIAGSRQLGQELLGKLIKLMRSGRYKSLFPDVRARFSSGALESAHGGFVSLAIVGQQLSGRGADLIIVDDPLSPSHAKDEARRNEVNAWFDDEVITRLNSQAGAILILMQRVHPNDLCGHIGPKSGFERLTIAGVAGRDVAYEVSDGRKFIHKMGEVMDPQRESRATLIDRLNQIGAFNFISQYLQGDFRVWSESEFRTGFVYSVSKNWTPEMELPGGFVRIPIANDILHEIFFVPRDGPKLVQPSEIPSDLLDRHMALLVETLNKRYKEWELQNQAERDQRRLSS